MWIRRTIVFLGALILYLICLDRGASLWDCPEYILIAWRLEVGHPPGNPTWQLAANVISHLGGSAEHAALLINLMSAVAMALAASFLSEIAFILLRQSLLRGKGRSISVWASVCAGAGALCYAWCDSAIFSAVEAEVYALSAMMTALMLLLSLKWVRRRALGDISGSRRLIILMAYLAGLGVGVHELNFLILPAMALVFWYGLRKYPLDKGKKTRRRIASVLPTVSFSLLLFIIGTSTYLLLPIRAAANPPVNEGDPSSWQSFKSYYSRDQYGSKPLLYGRTPYSKPLFLETVDTVTGAYTYNKYYLEEGKNGKMQNVYADELNMWFPRMTSSNSSDIEFYEAWAGMEKDAMVPVEASVVADSAGNQMGKINPVTGQREKERSWRPTYMQQARYFLGYQVGYMYLRYLLWNFAGRQNNVHSTGGIETGNFITGFSVLDDAMLGPQDELSPAKRENNVGYNRYFLIPLAFGIIGIVALMRSGRRGRGVCGLIATFFLFTGVLIVVYLNQDPGEPRERDYSFLGSYMAYSLWISCGLAAIVRALVGIPTGRRWVGNILKVVALLICVSLPLQMLSQTYDDHNRTKVKGAEQVAKEILEEVPEGAILLANGDNAIFPLWYAQEVLGWRRDVTVVAIPYLTADWYREQLKRPGEGAPGISLSEEVPRGTGSISDRAVKDIVDSNPDRPVFRTAPGKPPVDLKKSI